MLTLAIKVQQALLMGAHQRMAGEQALQPAGLLHRTQAVHMRVWQLLMWRSQGRMPGRMPGRQQVRLLLG